MPGTCHRYVYCTISRSSEHSLKTHANMLARQDQGQDGCHIICSPCQQRALSQLRGLSWVEVAACAQRNVVSPLAARRLSSLDALLAERTSRRAIYKGIRFLKARERSYASKCSILRLWLTCQAIAFVRTAVAPRG